MENNVARLAAEALQRLDTRLKAIELKHSASEILIASILQFAPHQQFLRTLDGREAAMKEQEDLTEDQKREIAGHLQRWRSAVQEWVEDHPAEPK